MRRLRLAVVATALVAVATGCIKGTVEMKVERDGSATMTMEIALDPKFAEMGSAFGDEEVDPEQARDELRQDLEADMDDLPEGATVEFEEVEIDGWPGLRVEIAGITVDDLAEMSGEEASSPGDFVGRDGEGWRFSMDTSSMMSSTSGAPLTGEELDSAPGGGTDELDDMGDMSELEEFGEELAKLMLGDASFTWRVTMPGKVTEHEGGKVSGSTVEWKIPLADPPERISASWDGQASPGGGGIATLPVVLAGVVVAAVAALVLWKRRGTPPPASEAPASPVGAAAPGGSTPGWPAPDAPVVEG